MQARLLSLDVLRGVAVLLVLIRHSYGAAGPWLEAVQRGGWVGVDLFFVLSGFLVSGLLFREYEAGQMRPIRFLIRRAWKIYPAFWVMVGFSAVFCTVVLGQRDDGKTLTDLLFLQSYVENRWWAHTWSLAVEEHFYILLPVVLVALGRRMDRLPRIVAWIMVALLVAKCINSTRPFTEQGSLFPTHLRLDGLFLGVLLCYWHRTWDQFNAFCKQYAGVLVGAGFLLLLPAFIWEVEKTPYLYGAGLTAQAIGSGAILMGFVCGGVPENALTKAIAWVGFYSYSIYLWHNIVIRIVGPLIGMEQTLLLTVGGSIVVGVGMANFIEVPALWLRDKLSPRPESAWGGCKALIASAR